jgi:NodT family efflux transporter outer membrane factor (OMF) lipoprotein
VFYSRPLSHLRSIEAARNEPTESPYNTCRLSPGQTGFGGVIAVVHRWFYGCAALAVLAASCAVGPDFRTPESTKAESYTSAPLPVQTESTAGTAGAAQHFATGRDIPAEWWSLFRSSPLDDLIKKALKNSPTIEAAVAALRQSQEQANAFAGSALYPKVDAGALVTRQKISGVAFGQPDVKFKPFTLYNATVNVTYSLDIFGGARRELESLTAQVEYQRFQLEGAQVALTANIVTTAIREASLRAQLRAIRALAAQQEEQLGIVERQFEVGAAARTDVLLQQGKVAQTKTLLAPLEKALAQTRHQLAVLAGQMPSESSALPEFQLDSFELPQELPVTLPSVLARQRPDIRAAESVLHAASAQVGVATANLYPQINISGAYGSTAETTGTLFSGGTNVWNIGAGLTQPLFHGGELRAKRRAAVAAYDGAAAGYRQTVLLAFQNVADVLRALELDAQALKAQTDADAAAKDSLETARKQYQIGATSHLAVLAAESQYEETHIGLVQAQATRFSDTAALFQALGGGWWNNVAAEGSAPEADKNSTESAPVMTGETEVRK